MNPFTRRCMRQSDVKHVFPSTYKANTHTEIHTHKLKITEVQNKLGNKNALLLYVWGAPSPFTAQYESSTFLESTLTN